VHRNFESEIHDLKLLDARKKAL